MSPRQKNPDNVTVVRRVLRKRAEKLLTAAGIPPRSGRRAEKKDHPPEEDPHRKRDRELDEWRALNRALAHLGRRPLPPPPPPSASTQTSRRPARRTWLYYQGGPIRVVCVAACWHCGLPHHQRRPPFQVEKAEGLPAGVYKLKQSIPAYCCTEHRIAAWRLRNRQHDDGITCQGPDCDVWVPRTPGPGRPSDYHDPRCKQRAYRARVAARRAGE